MIKILSIGNSFSQDATRYLHQVASCNNREILTENLYIGGCSLETHYDNIKADNKNYLLEINGNKTRVFVGIKESLLKEDWDYITLQQVSSSSVDYATYWPYLDEIADYVRKICPNAKIIIHQTWAYEDNSKRLCEELGYKKSIEMFNDIEASYSKAAKEIQADGIIPSGKLFNTLLENGLLQIYRDTFHASLGAGRLALALLWFKYLTNEDIDQIEFSELDEPVSKREIDMIIKSINEII